MKYKYIKGPVIAVQVLKSNFMDIYKFLSPLLDTKNPLAFTISSYGAVEIIDGVTSQRSHCECGAWLLRDEDNNLTILDDAVFKAQYAPIIKE